MRQLFGKNVSTGIRCDSERIMSVSFIGMSASCGSGTKPATLEVAKSGELSDEFHANSMHFLNFFT